MRPTDFPVPLLAPSVAQREGCTSLRLRLPPLCSCEEATGAEATAFDVEASRDGTDEWRVLVDDTEGGLVSAVRLDPQP